MRRCPKLLWLAGCLTAIAVCGLSRPVQAQPPSISSLSPQAVQPGKTVDLKLQGGALTGTTQLWTSFPAEATLPADLAGNNTKPAEVVYRLQIPANTGVGVYGLRVANSQGVSNLKLIAVDDLPSVAQVKPNQELSAAQPLPIPCAVDGTLANLTRDYYKFQVNAGQRLSFEVLGRRLGSPLDSMIRILDSRGREVVYSDDTPGLGPDSQLSHTFAQAGEYVVELRDIRFQGGATFHYRLRIGDFPCINVPYPMGVRRGSAATLSFAGGDVRNVSPLPLNVPAATPVNWLHVGGKFPGGSSSGFALVALSRADEANEVEPNNDQPHAMRLPLGSSINGRFDQPGDVDQFVFTAKAKQKFTFAGVTRDQGAASDLYFRLLKSDGGEVATADDTGTAEGILHYTFPADGDYTLVVEDLHRRGGPEFAYRIEVRPFVDQFQLSASVDTLNIGSGGIGTVMVTAKRGEISGPITLALRGAPEGLVATPSVIGKGQTAITMTIHCGTNVPAGKIYPVEIVGTATHAGTEQLAVADVETALKATLGGIVNPPPLLTKTVAIAVAPAPAFVLKTSQPEVIFGRDLPGKVKVIATKAAGFDEAIALAVTPVKGGLPAGITATLKPIAKGATEYEVVFSATSKARLGEFYAVLEGTAKKDKTTTVQAIPVLKLTLRAPFTLKADFGTGVIAKGQTLKVKVVADRNPAYTGPIAVTVAGLPKGVTAGAVSIPEGQTEAELVLTAVAEAAGSADKVIIHGEGKSGEAKLTDDAPAAKLKVE